MFELDSAVGMNYGETTKMVIESAKHFQSNTLDPI